MVRLAAAAEMEVYLWLVMAVSMAVAAEQHAVTGQVATALAALSE